MGLKKPSVSGLAGFSQNDEDLHFLWKGCGHRGARNSRLASAALQFAARQVPIAERVRSRLSTRQGPAKKEPNEEFGAIETRISQNKFVWEEVFLWLFKIHIGLMYRDTSLRSSIKDATSEPVMREEIIFSQLELFRDMFASYVNTGTLGTESSPPGSIFVLPSLSGRYFDFHHTFTTGCVGVNVGDYYLAGSLFDFKLAKDFGYFEGVWDKKNFGLPPKGSTSEQVAAWYHHVQAIWLCNLGYWSWRWYINMYRITKEYLPGVPEFDALPPIQRPETLRN